MPVIHRTPKYLAMNDLEQGMHVEVYHRYSSERQNGLVVDVVASNSGKMIDGKPVIKQNNIQVTIAYDNGGENLVLTSKNFNNYQIIQM